MEDSKKVDEALKSIRLDYAVCSPYKRSLDTIHECVKEHGLELNTEVRFREREAGFQGNSRELIRKRWADMDFHEEDGESIHMVQRRNVEALLELLRNHTGENIILGTHGTALSSILNYFDPSYLCDNFFRMIDFMPYIIRLDFDGEVYIGREELLIIQKEYKA
jgi:2,3-bisphosphoglycerate-dependent phosphoglycerate mutase